MISWKLYNELLMACRSLPGLVYC